jgi:hypothetical protein
VHAERYRVFVCEQEAFLRAGEEVRLARFDAEPSATGDAIEAFRDAPVPWLAQTPGFRGALLFADQASGHMISQTAWRDPQALAAAPAAVATVRAGAVGAGTCLIRAVEDHIVVFSSAASLEETAGVAR